VLAHELGLEVRERMPRFFEMCTAGTRTGPRCGSLRGRPPTPPIPPSNSQPAGKRGCSRRRVCGRLRIPLRERRIGSGTCQSAAGLRFRFLHSASGVRVAFSLWIDAPRLSCVSPVMYALRSAKEMFSFRRMQRAIELLIGCGIPVLLLEREVDGRRGFNLI